MHTSPRNPKPTPEQEKEAKKKDRKHKKDKRKKDKKKKDKKKSKSASDDDANAGPPRRAHVPVQLHEKDDYYRRQNEFRVWLKLARGTAFEVRCCGGGLIGWVGRYVVDLVVGRPALLWGCVWWADPVLSHVSMPPSP